MIKMIQMVPDYSVTTFFFFFKIIISFIYDNIHFLLKYVPVKELNKCFYFYQGISLHKYLYSI